MQTDNPLYLKQGIHVIVSLLTVDNGIFKVLLLKRKKQPFKDQFCLLGGAVYNNEDLEHAVMREMLEKTKITDVKPQFFGLFSSPNRAKETGFRMLGVGYLALTNNKAIKFASKSEKASEIAWKDIQNLSSLAYDHTQVLQQSIEFLKKQIFKSDIIKTLFPNYVTIPELQNVYQTILGKTFDRRNFRKKLLTIGLIEDSGQTIKTGKKPSKLYKIKKIKQNLSL